MLGALQCTLMSIRNKKKRGAHHAFFKKKSNMHSIYSLNSICYSELALWLLKEHKVNAVSLGNY